MELGNTSPAKRGRAAMCQRALGAAALWKCIPGERAWTLLGFPCKSAEALQKSAKVDRQTFIPPQNI